MKRRDALFVGGMVAIAAGWQWFGVRKPEVVFTDIRRAPGWSYASVGGVSGLSGADFATIGLEPSLEPIAAGDLDTIVHRDHQAGQVPVAVFSDFFCPYCRGLIGRLASRTASPSLGITWHELPLLGRNSVLAAKAAEAAALQGGYKAFYEQLIGDGFRPTARWMGDVAQAAGLDRNQLLQDMDGPAVADRLEMSARAASTLGFSGTPGIAIGRKAILGALEKPDMEAVFEEVGTSLA